MAADFRLRLSAFCLPILVGSCSATIHLREQPSIAGTIAGGDPDSVYLRDDVGTIWQVPRAAIADIEHPGETLRFWGWFLDIVPGLVATVMWHESSARAQSFAGRPPGQARPLPHVQEVTPPAEGLP